MLVFITGCDKNKTTVSSSKKSFSITCTGDSEKMDKMETQNETTYNFNNEQYVISYSVTTTQKFTDKSLYNEYKTAQEQTVSDSSDDVSYELKSDDKALSLVFTMTINNIDINNAETEEEKDSLKAKSILESLESSDYKCTLNDITKADLK